ncbi:glucosamine-6-phosphate isomerase [Plebeiibacterium marinum]|uniref:Glucosamine-6-phosphate isomerase n=1 Tax=Plebeiibacterium marinum TaxID=2992111 RepID=A0AAE3MG37_9BACT|nr:glucosamine-6-phosphate isomerase [Plebeiobacterium marinum]MCW3806387.1 glucosamine-6-phosphate isomerase [Plebeiobacterium marinum]
MEKNNFSSVEKHYFKKSNVGSVSTQVPYIPVDNFPQLGMFTALRFLEWVADNPEGVISLPTGKTPEYFIRWTQYLLENWNNAKGKKIREENGLKVEKKPDLSKLHFVQIDEFYPINSSQHNSFYHYVKEYYIKGFGLDPERALLINSDEIPLVDGKHFSEVFPDSIVDLSLRYREAKTQKEKEQQKSIFMIDDWCVEYESKIREKGGIGFFLGGIGPDGHIAFNTRGSDHFSTTRLTKTNFETQAQAAGDLGGIEVSKNRLVITIGLESITYNKDAVALIFAAGEAKAGVVKNALESKPTVMYPATVLQKLPNSRFYITKSSGVKLNDSVDAYYKTGEWTQEKTERAIIDLCKRINKFGPKLELSDLKSDPYCSLIPGLSLDTVQQVMDSVKGKLANGLKPEINQAFYHTGPHHDDIQLGIQPHVNRILREKSNKSVFSVLTSGFTAVTNDFVTETLNSTKKLLDDNRIQMVNFPDFFEAGYQYKWDKDVYHFLLNVASEEPLERVRGLCHRVVRAIVAVWEVKDKDGLRNTINAILANIRESYDGQKNPPKIQKLKGMIREFEEELVWAHSGVQVKNVRHLRLGFYTGDIFTEQPNRERDVAPILEELRKEKPTVISLALDPEGSGPDTHYKVLQAIADAVRLWSKEEDLSNLRIWGYRNVWFKFAPSEINVMVPVSINGLDVLDKSFSDCYLSQVNASFPSHEHDGKFSTLAKRIWAEQLENVQYLLGKDYFYTNEDPNIRASHGLIFFKEMNVDEFLKQARELEKSMEG